MKTLITLIFTLLSLSCFAQKIEYSLQLNSTLSEFRGSTASSLSYVYEVSPSSNDYTAIPYGAISEWGYGASGDIKLVIKTHFLFGVQAGYEVSKTRTDLMKVFRFYTADGPPVDYYGGYTTLTSSYIIASPYLGYRVNVKKLAFDLTPGVDIARGLHSRENGQTVTNETPPVTITVNTDRNTPPTDIRLRCDLKVYYRNFGILGGYAHGTKNYSNDLNPYDGGGTVHAQLNVMRLGISYRIY